MWKGRCCMEKTCIKNWRVMRMMEKVELQGKDKYARILCMQSKKDERAV